ncbi:hypothetical protein [Fluviispira multicolorata]|uniref:Uncharacterized protein n=1 Tax=Fluviispira multicolorata TaxID=2654512 RepID=A0A833N391_9BACT|nr:hypothetical protein [Fluviispira multicolorata]KAB8029714.1 hypothetical protein GCL57_09215 [Fluviispira multicolorata]
MKNFKIFLAIKDENIKQSLQEMISKDFKLVTTPQECDVFLSDDHSTKSEKAVNILVVNVTRIPDFKGVNNLDGFHHYIIFNENDFLEERVRKALIRQYSIKIKKENEEITGVRSIITLDPVVHSSGIKLPIIRNFIVKSSKERLKFAEELEKFFDEIEPVTGSKNPTLSQYAVEIQEELLMNAIWDANPKHAMKPRTTPIDLEPGEEVHLEWAFNGKELAISVKDIFGRLNPEIMDKYVNFIFKTGQTGTHLLSNQQVSAGLGMFMIIQRANLLSVFISQGKLTDVGVVIRLLEKRRTKSQSAKAIDIIQVDE